MYHFLLNNIPYYRVSVCGVILKWNCKKKKKKSSIFYNEKGKTNFSPRFPLDRSSFPLPLERKIRSKWVNDTGVSKVQAVVMDLICKSFEQTRNGTITTCWPICQSLATLLLREPYSYDNVDDTDQMENCIDHRSFFRVKKRKIYLA